MKNMTCSAIALLFLSACGGGGSDSAPPAPPIVEVPPATPPVAQATPNILLIISDDQGLDASAQYGLSLDVPSTPTMDALASNGLVFENVWATPACATTRATLLSGLYGINNGIRQTPGVLSADVETIQEYLSLYPETSAYESAVFGKWHLGGADNDHPGSVGIPHFAGNLGNVGDYYSWDLVTNGVAETSTEYHTSKITDLAIDWIDQRAGPWFAWVAYSAPHSPFHLPPQNLHSRNLSGTADDIAANSRDYYLAAIESMDSELGRVLDSLTVEERDNTIVMFIGDNGTPKSTIDLNVYRRPHGKGSLYEGGVRVPMIVSGADVTRSGEREDSLIVTTDFFATIAEIAGSNVTSIYDSESFAGSFSDSDFAGRDTSYVGYSSEDLDGWAVSDGTYKLIQTAVGGQEMYDVSVDIGEINNLLPGDAAIEAKRVELAQTALQIESSGGNGGGGGGSGNSIDITDAMLTNRNASCSDYVESYSSNVTDIFNNVAFVGDLVVELIGDKCIFTTNAIPNHDFNDSDRFPNPVSEQTDVYEVPTTPEIAPTTTDLSLTYDNAILLNGVKTDVLAAACFGVGDGRVGCNNINQPWRYDPMYAANGFRVDSHNAHTQPDGTYHYHGSPNALFYADTNIVSPLVGFAADGFPIYGSWFDDNGLNRKATSSYQLKAGARPSGAGEPGGNYDGTYRDDYEYVQGSGDLDECNGMTVDGVYGYYIIDAFPYVLGCFKGVPDLSFRK
jgi:arylsulfatase A-like enzyme